MKKTFNTKVIAILGGPGVGKSTIATGLFSKMKQRKISCEYVSEYAKEVTWEETQKLLENQIHVFSEQFRRQYRLINKVEYIITDSPLILNSIYFDYYLEKIKPTEQFFSESFINLTREFFDHSFDQFYNISYQLGRIKQYDSNGRNQNLEEARKIDKRIVDKLNSRNIDFMTLNGNEDQNIEDILNGVIR